MGTKGTPITDIYPYFLLYVQDREWVDEELIETYEQEWEMYLLSAIPLFKNARVDLNIENGFFKEELTNEEIQILAVAMATVWSKRLFQGLDAGSIGYSERDWKRSSMAPVFLRIQDYNEYLDDTLAQRIDIYDRRERGKPRIFNTLAGKNKGRR